MHDIIELNNKLVGELKEIAKNLNIPKYETLYEENHPIHTILASLLRNTSKHTRAYLDALPKKN